jgi:hypothetical protein
MENNIPTEQISPLLDTEMGSGRAKVVNERMTKKSNQGTGNLQEAVIVRESGMSWEMYPIEMSNKLEPIELLTAMSPRPLRATITLKEQARN